MSEQVAIIGAGVSGLTCGVLFAERGYRASIFAEETGTRTTSGAAAAIWFPYDAEPADAVIEWALRTHDVLRELGDAPETGVSMLELRSFSRAQEIEIPAWADSLGAKRLPASATPTAFQSGYALRVPLTDTTRYLDYLAERFRAADGEIYSGVRLQRLEDVGDDCDLIINCSGIGAARLVPDPEMEAHRGQVVVVASIDLPYAIVCNDPPLMYAIPRAHDCVFGGTNHVSDDREPDPAMTADILAECSRVLNIDPRKILTERVGLRPFRRAGICLHAAELSDGRRVIHNYGHGGSGFTLSWGCAEEVLALAAGR
jgi:D-amino-acid oxidase